MMNWDYVFKSIVIDSQLVVIYWELRWKDRENMKIMKQLIPIFFETTVARTDFFFFNASQQVQTHTNALIHSGNQLD
jgi:hypothetical protein